MEKQVKQKSLSDEDKCLIKQAVLKSVANNQSYSPEELAKLACEAISLIENYKP